MRSSSSRLDLTQGAIFPLILRFALPLCIGNILQQLYSTVDTLVISNFCGTRSLAAIGTSAQPIEILLCVFIGIGSGVSILVAQHTGSGDADALRTTVRNASGLLYLCALPVTLLGFLLGPQLLRLMQVPEDTLPYAVSYMSILFAGTLAAMGYNTTAGILRGLGDSKATLYFLAASCFVNILLDLLFVAGFGWDITGAALATIIAQYASWILSAHFLRRHYPEAGCSLLPCRIDFPRLRPLIRVGLPLGLNNSIYSFGHLVLQLLVNMQGTAFMASWSVGTKITSLVNIVVLSLSASASTFAGQNLGAGRRDRLALGAWRIPMFSGMLTLLLACVIVFFARPILSIFRPAPDVTDMAIRYLQLVTPSYAAYAVFNAIINYVNGMGEVRYSTIVNILMLWAVRIPSALLIQRFFDGSYIMLAYPISFIFGMLAMFCFFLTPAWKRIRYGN